MSKLIETTTSSKVNDFIVKRFAGDTCTVHPVNGGYSRNRRAIIDIGSTSVFAKEVDIDVLPDEGMTELGWLRKDYEIINELAKHAVSIVPEWAELHLDGHLLLLPAYKKEEGWHWTLPTDKPTQIKYIQAVIDATKELEVTALPDELTTKLSLQPFFRDEIAGYNGLAQLFKDADLRERLITKYTKLQSGGGHLLPMYIQMVKTLSDNTLLKNLEKQTLKLGDMPNDFLNHCDVRSDNITYNEMTGKVTFVDWNWTSYAPAKFGATEFLLDMARRGVDVSAWYDDMSAELLAATVGYYMIRSLKPPRTPGSTLRDMQAETAAVANYLYMQLA